MACNLTAGIQIGCRDNTGGLKTLWITDYDNVLSITQSTGDTITAISGTCTFYEFQLIRTTSQLTETVNASLENGTVFYGGEIVTYFNKLEQTKRNILKTLAQSQRLAIVVEDNNGQYFYCGQTYGCYVGGGNSASGLQLGDKNGYSINFNYLEPNPMNQLSGSLASIAQGITVQS